MNPTMTITVNHGHALRSTVLRFSRSVYDRKSGPTRDIDDVARKLSTEAPSGPLTGLVRLGRPVPAGTRITLTYNEVCLLHDAIDEDTSFSYGDNEWRASKRIQRKCWEWLESIPTKPVTCTSVQSVPDHQAILRDALRGPRDV